MAEFSDKLYEEMREMEGRGKAPKLARELKVSLASLYNYLKKTDLPSYEVLKRAHDNWGWSFKYIDFGARSARAPSEEEQPRQYVLPFIDNVHQSDIQVTRAKAVRPDCLELTVQIRFVG